jgi:hypothetical protein
LCIVQHHLVQAGEDMDPDRPVPPLPGQNLYFLASKPNREQIGAGQVRRPRRMTPGPVGDTISTRHGSGLIFILR